VYRAFGWQRAMFLQHVVADPRRKSYYEIPDETQSGSLDITEWLRWFLECLDRAIEHSNQITSSALVKESFWLDLKKKNFSLIQRQKKVLNKLLGDLEGKLTREKWTKPLSPTI
jgi:Fic family protein